MAVFQKIKKRLFKPKQEDQFSGELPFFDVLQLVLENLTDIKNIEFLQIGAADGASQDPIFDLVKEHHWKGSLIEASPSSYEKLIKNYDGHSNLKFRNVLVSDQEDQTSLTFYEIKQDFRGSFWTEQCSSLSLKMVQDSLHYLSRAEGIALPDNLDDAISKTDLPCVHIRDLVQGLGIVHLDLLVVDTMGHDARILQAFPFDTLTPSIIMFEHSLLDNQEKISLLNYLASKGYAFIKYSVDTIAIKSDKARVWSVDEW